jgi:two-component system CheB/CheR fusion protein
VRVEPNHVYVVSPNQSLEMIDGHIVVEPIQTIEERRAPVDIFFRTLGESHGARALPSFCRERARTVRWV